MDDSVDIYEQAALNMSIPDGCDVNRVVYASIKQLISHDIIDPSSVGFQNCEPLVSKPFSNHVNVYHFGKSFS